MLKFSTPYGRVYTVNEQGQIDGSNNWHLIGIASTHGFAFGKQVLTFEQLTPEVIKATQWRYKTSGNPRFTVIDLDHGTRRVWGNTKYHGISSMWYEN